MTTWERRLAVDGGVPNLDHRRLAQAPPEEEASATRARRRRPSIEHAFLLVTPLTVVLLWQLLSDNDVIDPRVWSSPTEVVSTTLDMVEDGSLADHSWPTFRRFVLGATIGVFAGSALGMVMGLSRVVRAVVNPLILMTYPLPRIAIFPLLLLLMGIGERSNVTMIATQPFYFMVMGVMSAVLNVEPIYFRVAASFETGRWHLLRLVLVPATLPTVMTSLRLALGGALFLTVTVEALQANEGMGYLIWHSWQILSLDQAMVALVVVGVFGYLLLQGLDLLERWLVPWSGVARSR